MSMSGPVGIGGFEEGEFEGDSPTEEVVAHCAAQPCCGCCPIVVTFPVNKLLSRLNLRSQYFLDTAEDLNVSHFWLSLILSARARFWPRNTVSNGWISRDLLLVRI